MNNGISKIPRNERSELFSEVSENCAQLLLIHWRPITARKNDAKNDPLVCVNEIHYK